MIETNLNIFDAVVIGIMLLSCVFAFFRGLVKEILSLAAWIGAGIITVYYFPAVVEKLQPHFKSQTVAAAAGTIGLYIVALLGFSIINMLIIKTIKSGGNTGMLDNMLGLAFGALRGAFVISLGFFLLTVALPDKEYPKWVKQSVTHPYAERGAIVLARVAPDYLKEISSLQKKATEQLRETQKTSPYTNNYTQSDDNTGYNRSTTRQIDRLIDSTNHN